MIADILDAAIDSESKPFWDGLKKKELLIQLCGDCDQFIFYPRSICPNCFSEQIHWYKSNGTGNIYSFTVVHHAFCHFKEEVPFIVAIVELDEGVRMMTRIIGDREDIAIGKRVSVVYQKINEQIVLPYFEVI